MNRIIGMGLQGPVSSAEFDIVEEFYRRHQSICEVVVSPYADMSLVGHLGDRGYRITEWNTVLVRELSTAQRFDTRAVDVRPVLSGEARVWADVVSRGFGLVPGVTPDLFVPFATVPSAMCFLAYVDGEAAGGAGGSLFPEVGIAPLYGASTLPEFRGRGIQNALFQARLRRAAGAGCELAVVCTQPGTVSQRNAERNGFQVAYTKVAMQRQV
jgi:GNAT superfamily N-acetyltransferase